MEFELEMYTLSNGKIPFDVWLNSIKERHTRAKILTRLDRLRFGNFGDCKPVGEGVYELRIHYGPGIRVYYSQVGKKVVLLLLGGVKQSQDKDIKKAKSFLRDVALRGGIYGKK